MWARIKNSLFLILPLGVFLALWLMFWEPKIAGFIYDDGLYLLGARSLAEGQGYVIREHVPIIKYPPLFPALLSLIWLVWPTFPENLVAFKGFSLICIMLALLIFGFWLRRQGNSRLEAGALVLLIGLHPLIVHWSREVMSEPLYLLLTLAGLYWLDTWRQAPAPGKRRILLLALLSAAAFYTRSAGLSYVTGISVWLLRRYGRQVGLVYIGVVVLLCLPWFLWQELAGSSVVQTDYYWWVPFNQSYALEWMTRLLRSGSADVFFLDAPVKLLQAIGDTIFPLPALPGMDKVRPFVSVSLSLAVLGILFRKLWQEWRNAERKAWVFYLASYLVLLLFWSGQTLSQFHRFLIVVLPLMLWLLLDFLKNRKRYAVYATLCCLLISGSSLWRLGLRSWEHSQYLQLASIIWQDYEDSFRFIDRNLPKNAQLLAQYPMVYSLYTDLRFDLVNMIPRMGVSVSDEVFQRRFAHDLRQTGLRYVLLESFYQGGQDIKPYNEFMDKIIRANPDQYILLYRTPRGFIRLYQVLDKP